MSSQFFGLLPYTFLHWTWKPCRGRQEWASANPSRASDRLIPDGDAELMPTKDRVSSFTLAYENA